MTILFAAPMIDYSGAPKIMVWLANSFYREGNEVHLLTYNSEPQNQNIIEGIHRKCLYIKKESNWIKRNSVALVKSARGLLKYAEEIHADYVLTFTDNVSMFALFGKHRLNAKVYISERMDPYTNTGIMDKLRRKLFRLADGVVFQTEGAQAYFCESVKKKSVVIPNPVILKSCYIKSTERNNHIVCVGRLDITQKRQDLLIESFKLIEKEFPDMELHIFGDGDDKERIEQIISENNLQQKVYLRGVSTDVYYDIKDAKVFAFASDFEGIPNALIEAMSMGIPVVATDCSPGGARMLINSYVNGILVNRGDKVQLAEAIKYILENQKEAEQMAVEAMKITDRFNEKIIFSKWKDYLQG